MAALPPEVLDAEATLGSGPVAPPLSPLRTALLVAAGGGIGAALRFGLALLLPTVTTPTLVELPWATLWVNVIGCLGLGALTGVLEVRRGRSWLPPLLGTGLCGGFTTLSTVVLEGSAMIGAGFPLIAFVYALTTLVLCLTCVVVGLVGGRRLARPAAFAARRTPLDLREDEEA